MGPTEAPGRRIDSFAAVLWDMDGTLVDTEPYWIVAELALAERYGGTWSRRAGAGAGRLRPARRRARYMREQMGIDARARADRRGDARRGDRAGGARRAVARGCASSCSRRCGEAGVPCALVTMSYTRFVKPILDGAAGGHVRARWSPATPSTAASRTRSPTSTAARELDVLAGECLAIEDSDTGATSAVAAGCTVLCAPLHVPVPPGPGRVFTDSLVGLSAASPAAGLSCGLVPNRDLDRSNVRFGTKPRNPSPPAIVVGSRPPRDHGGDGPHPGPAAMFSARTRPVGVGLGAAHPTHTRG